MRTTAATFTTRMTEALGFPVRDPLRLLALAVILRWQEDGACDEIDAEWIELAEVPPRWLVRGSDGKG